MCICVFLPFLALAGLRGLGLSAVQTFPWPLFVSVGVGCLAAAASCVGALLLTAAGAGPRLARYGFIGGLQ